MKHALLLSLGLAFVATASSSIARDASRHRPEAPKSWFTPAQKAYVQAECGVDPEDGHGNLNINGSVMTCPNGKKVNDPQVAAMSADIKRRTDAYVRAVMADVDVQRGLAMATSEHVRKAIKQANVDARVAEAMAHAADARAINAQVRKALDDAQIDLQVERALAQAEIGRKTAQRIHDALAKAGYDTH